MPTQPESESTPRSRTNRRVQWHPEGVTPDPAFVDTPVEDSGEDWAERQLSNDEQLKRDIPPHWG
jgi:hypothetical protein